jgi:archaellum component FlaC
LSSAIEFIGNLCLDKLTDDLHSMQKSSRSYSDQLSDTKKRLRDTQHDLKELEEKYKRYSDALYRVRSESRSTLDQLTHVLGIKEKQPSQARKTDDEPKKAATPVKVETKSSNENDKKRDGEKTNEQDETITVEGMPTMLFLSMHLNVTDDLSRK